MRQLPTWFPCGRGVRLKVHSLDLSRLDLGSGAYRFSVNWDLFVVVGGGWGGGCRVEEARGRFRGGVGNSNHVREGQVQK